MTAAPGMQHPLCSLLPFISDLHDVLLVILSSLQKCKLGSETFTYACPGRSQLFSGEQFILSFFAVDQLSLRKFFFWLLEQSPNIGAGEIAEESINAVAVGPSLPLSDMPPAPDGEHMVPAIQLPSLFLTRSQEVAASEKHVDACTAPPNSLAEIQNSDFLRWLPV